MACSRVIVWPSAQARSKMSSPSADRADASHPSSSWRDAGETRVQSYGLLKSSSVGIDGGQHMEPGRDVRDVADLSLQTQPLGSQETRFVQVTPSPGHPAHR
jgi:hypothetical protein